MKRFELPLPPSSNNAFPDRRDKFGRPVGGRRMSTEAKAWRAEALRILGRHVPFERPVAIKGECWFPAWRGDVANRGKLAVDALKIAGVIRDDAVRYVRSETWECLGVDAEHPRMVLSVWEVWQPSQDEVDQMVDALKAEAERRIEPVRKTLADLASLAQPSTYRRKP